MCVPSVKIPFEGGDHGNHVPNMFKYQVEGVGRTCYGRSDFRQGRRELNFEYAEAIIEGVDQFGKVGQVLDTQQYVYLSSNHAWGFKSLESQIVRFASLDVGDGL